MERTEARLPAPPRPEVSPEILARAIWGDEAALEELLRFYDRSIRLLAWSLVGDSTADVVQDAYVKVYRSLPGFRVGSGSVGGWLARIVYTTAIDHLRSERRRSGAVERLQPAREAGVEERVLARDGVARALQLGGEL